MTTHTLSSSFVMPHVADRMNRIFTDDTVQIKSLQKGDVLTITTTDGEYTFILFNPAESLACMLSTDPRYNQPSICCIQGSTAGGSMLAMGAIAIDGYLEVGAYEYGLLSFSKTDSITLDVQNGIASLQKIQPYIDAVYNFQDSIFQKVGITVPYEENDLRAMCMSFKQEFTEDERDVILKNFYKTRRSTKNRKKREALYSYLLFSIIENKRKRRAAQRNVIVQ